MKNLRNKNQPPPETAIQTYLSSSWDKVLAVYAKLAEIETLADTITAGDLDGFLSDTDIDTIAKLNAILTDATLGDFASQAEAEAGVSNTKTMTPLRVAQAIAVLAAGIQNNFNGAGAPSVTDDSDAGYSAGSVWIDTVAVPNESYRCADPTVGAAVWLKTTLTSDELALVALSGSSDDLVEGVTQLLMTVAERDKLTNIEPLATADQTPAEIEAGYNSQVAIVTQGEAEAGVLTDVKRWTPERVKQAIAALASGGLAWSSANSSIAVVKNTGTMFYALAATVTATLPASPAVGDSLMIVNNDSNALGSYLVQVTAGGSNEIRQQNVTSIPQATLTQGQTGLFVCYDAGATKRWHMTKWVSSLDIGSGGGGLIPEFKTANFTAEAGKTYFCDTTIGAIVATLPAGVDAANIVFVDAVGNCSTNPVTINPDGLETIHNDTTFVLDQNFGQVNAAYKAADTNWQVALVGYPEVIVGSGTALEAEIDARVVAVASGVKTITFKRWDFQLRAGSAAEHIVGTTVGPLGIKFDAQYYNAYGCFTLPKSWDQGQVRFRVFHGCNGVQTTDSIFQLALLSLVEGDAYTPPSTGASVTDAKNGTAEDVLISPWSSWFTVSGTLSEDALIYMKLQRNDNNAGVPFMVAVQLQYTTDAPTDN